GMKNTADRQNRRAGCISGAAVQTADKHFPGGLEGPQALQSGFVSPGFAGRAGRLRPWAQTFLKHLAKKAAIGGLFRQTESPRRMHLRRGGFFQSLVFSRRMKRMGVPAKPKLLRRWFSR